MNENIHKLLSMTHEDWVSHIKKSQRLTEQDGNKYQKYFDIGDETISKFIESVGALPIKEVEHKLNQKRDEYNIR